MPGVGRASPVHTIFRLLFGYTRMGHGSGQLPYQEIKIHTACAELTTLCDNIFLF